MECNQSQNLKSCTFNLNFAAKRKGIDMSVTYFTSLVLEALQ